MRRCLFFLTVGLLILGIWAGRARAGLRAVFLNVGEGDAAYVETSGGRRILIDAGNPMGGNRVVRFLAGRGVDSLDALFVTHPHPDHAGGVFVLLDRVSVRRIYDNGQEIDAGAGDMARWYAEYVRGRAEYEALAAGRRLAFGAMVVTVLWPRRPFSANWNDNSLVLRLRFGRTAWLFTGDAGLAVERALAAGREPLRADVLKVAHHGAADATGPEFLDRVRPVYAVISVNPDNVRGYPAASTLQRLAGRGIRVLQTRILGDVVLESDGAGVRAAAGGP